MAYIRVSLLLLLLIPTIIAEQDPLQDFCVADTSSSTLVTNGLPCIDPTKVSPKHFTTSVLNTKGNATGNPFGLSVTAANTQTLPGINTLGIIIARVDLSVGGILPPHTHPRATEIYFLLEGDLRVGFVDTNNKLFSAEIKAGDVFVFPKALVHFAENIGKTSVSAIAALNSQNPGIQTIPVSTFASEPAIPTSVLVKAFQIKDTDVDVIRKKLGGS